MKLPPQVTAKESAAPRRADLAKRLSVEMIGTLTACDARGRAYTLFRLRVADGRSVWEVQRRFRQFQRLAAQLAGHAELEGSCARPPALPAALCAGRWGVGRSVDPQLVATRAVGLQAFLEEALSALAPGAAPLDAFLRDGAVDGERARCSTAGTKDARPTAVEAGSCALERSSRGRGSVVQAKRFDPPALVRAGDMEWTVMWEEPLAVV